jgi:hypothetical protein
MSNLYLCFGRLAAAASGGPEEGKSKEWAKALRPGQRRAKMEAAADIVLNLPIK